MKFKVFIDGAEGTTGLKIHSYFAKRDDIDVLNIATEKRKDLEERLALIKKADVSFLCLPDKASEEIAAAAPSDCRILDTSTRHRTAEGWVYGMPELTSNQREMIKNSNRVAVPGCHATGVILLTRPLIDSGLVSADYHFAATSLTGYSGGGKKMIAQYEEEELPAPRMYGISQTHKHLPEITAMTGMTNKPAFMPIVADYYSGMEVSIPIQGSDRVTVASVTKALKEAYEGQPLVKVRGDIDEAGFISAQRLSGKNSLEIAVYGSDENILLVATYDNLGKGASGAAIQNMNIMLGIEETKGLI